MRGGGRGEGWFGTQPPRFFGQNFLLLDQLQNAFVQLFLNGERIFLLIK